MRPRIGDWDPPFPVDLEARPARRRGVLGAAPRGAEGLRRPTPPEALAIGPYGTATSLRIYVPALDLARRRQATRSPRRFEQ